MLNRWFGISAFLAMCTLNTLLVLRDVAPRWFATDPPRPTSLRLSDGEQLVLQYGIFRDGRRVGTAQHLASASGDVIRTETATALSLGEMLDVPGAPTIRVDSDFAYLMRSQMVDELSVRVRGLPFGVHLKGQYLPPNDFPIQWRLGDNEGSLILPADQTSQLGDMLRPFQSLPDLYVGRTWRLQTFNPLLNLLPMVDRNALELEPVLVRVAAEERISFADFDTLAFRVEADRIRVWVDWQGQVLRQQIELPVLGLLQFEVERYDPSAFNSGQRGFSP